METVVFNPDGTLPPCPVCGDRLVPRRAYIDGRGFWKAICVTADREWPDAAHDGCISFLVKEEQDGL